MVAASAAPGRGALIVAVYLPGILVQLGIGSMIPMIPHASVTLGGTLALAGVLAALLPAARAAFDIPGGALLARLGVRLTMVLACTLGVLGLGLAATGVSLWLLGAGIAFAGVASIALMLAQQTYLSGALPEARRAGAMSALGALVSVGSLVGPVIGAAIIHLSSIWAVLWFGAGAMALAAIIVLVSPGMRASAAQPAERTSEKALLRRTVTILGTLGVGTYLVSAARGIPQFGLPLWTEHLEFDPAVTSLIYGAFNAGILGLSPVAALLMRRYGRLLPTILQLAGVAGCLVWLPFAQAPLEVGVCALTLGMFMGLGVGVFLTIAGDVQAHDQAQFFGIWRVLMDGGNATGPLILSATAAVGVLSGGLFVGAALTVPATILVARFLPKYSAQATRRTRRAAGLPVDSG